MFSEARRQCEHGLQLDSSLSLAHKELADLMCGEGEYEAAISHYLEALRLQPSYVEAKQNLAFARSLVRH